MTQFKKYYTRKEMGVIRDMVKRYKAGERVEGLTTEATKQLEGRTAAGVLRKIYQVASGRPKNIRRKKHSILRGSRTFTPEGLKKMKANGSKQWEKMKDRLRECGLTEDRIKYVFSGKRAEFTKNQVASIEAILKDSERATFTFITNPDMTISIIQEETRLIVEHKNGFDKSSYGLDPVASL